MSAQAGFSWHKAVQPLASLARQSARYPIEVILTSLLLSSIAYISMIHYYFKEWEDTFHNIIDTSAFDKKQLLKECSHYYYSKKFDSWKQIAVPQLELLNQTKHYYLYTYNFQDHGHEIPFPTFDSVLYEAGSTKYLLCDALNKPSEYIKVGNAKLWELATTKQYLLQIKDQLLGFVKRITIRNNLEQVDLILILIAYCMVLGTIIDLYQEMKRVGSRFWLTLSSLINSTCAFFLASFTMLHVLKTPISTLAMVQTLPFFFVLVGFKDKVRLSAYIIERFGTLNISKKITIDKIVFDAFSNVAIRMFQFYLTLFSIGCLGILYFKDNVGITNCLLLLTFILIFDFLLTATFYSAILCLKLEITTIKRSTIIRQALEEEGNENAGKIALDDNARLQNFPYIKSKTMVTLGKISLCALLIGLNIYNINLRWVLNTVQTIFLSFQPTRIPKEVISISHPSEWDGKDIIISIVPTIYYQPLAESQKSENLTMFLFRVIGAIIADRLIGKVLFMICLISVTTNVYLLRIAKIHSDATIDQYYSKQDQIHNKKGDTSSIGAQKVLSSTDVTVPSSTPKIFSLDVSDEESEGSTSSGNSSAQRTLDECTEELLNGNVQQLHNSEIANLVIAKKIPIHALERTLGDKFRAVPIRREAISVLAKAQILNTSSVPYKNYDYERVYGSCCENVIGYVPLPLGIMGPIIIDGKSYHVPMATTEGCLVASATRGCKAINEAGGASTILTKDGMTRGPCIRFPSLVRSGACKLWLDSDEGQTKVKAAFNSTSRFARLQHIKTALAGDLLFIRFTTTTGDAMGMNMISKGVEYSLTKMITEYGWDDMEIVSLSGNYCTDKKPAAINWIEGRGKSVCAEVIIPAEVVSRVLKCDVKTLVDLNISKNLIGSAMAGSVGGFNAHSANIVTAIFLALGQDPAQNIESSNCITLMGCVKGDLKVSVSMPSIEVGTIGGGTILETQNAMLELLNVRGPNQEIPGENARQLAKIIACSVLAGELSLCAALATGQLVKSHMILNRKNQT